MERNVEEVEETTNDKQNQDLIITVELVDVK